jgi:diguanylate cyclase (GGDEF)-like protein
VGDTGIDAGVIAGSPAMTTLPGFELFEELGRGATTVVHRARRRDAGGPDVAVKILRERSADATAVAAGYRREAALLARVTHPCVTAVHAAGEAAGRPYLVLELVDGVSLADLIRSGPLDEARTVRFAIDIAEALSAVHRMRLVHRDIKPQNVMVTDGGQTKLIDFDLATWAGELADETVAGTLVYSAPEQNGMLARPVDARADLYALGAVLFECVTGRPPFSAPDVGQLLHLHAVTAPPDIRGLRPACSPALAAIIHKLLAKDPDDRYQSAAGLVVDLQYLVARPDDWPFTLDSLGLDGGDDRELALTGRDAELDRLLRRWARAQRGAGGVVQIDGPVGVGKSRLCRELTTTISQRGGCTLRTTCTDNHVPLGALRAAIDRHIGAVLQLPAGARDAAQQRIRQAAQDTGHLLTDLSPALNTMLDTPAVDDDRGIDHQQAAAAIARFLAELARGEDGLLLLLDDAQHLDPTSARVLRHLSTEWDTLPLLVVLAAPAHATAQLQADLGTTPDLRVALEPLSPQAVVELIAGELGGADVSSEIADQLASRTDGNPFAVLEYVRHLVDAGGLQPRWGTWVLETRLLDRLQLPSDVLALMMSRLEGLDAGTRHLMAAAAVQGMRFDTTVAAAVSGAPDDFADALASATRHRVVEHASGDVHAFVHVQLRDALIDDIDWTELATLHRRTAAALEAQDRGPEHVFAVAHHRMASGDESAADAFSACVTAGNLALVKHSPALAARYFGGALHAARIAGLDVDVDFLQAYATALLRTGDFAAARVHVTRALDLERDGMTRAALFGLLAKAWTAEGEGDEALLFVRRGLAELGVPLPGSMLVLVVSSLVRLIAGLAVGAFGYGRASGPRRERHRLEAALLDAGGQAAPLSSQPLLIPLLPLRGLLPANRVGRSPQRTRVLAALGMTIGYAGARRTGTRVCAAADLEARALGDPGLLAMTTWLHAVLDMMIESSNRPLLEHLETHGRWLELPDYLSQIGILVPLLNDDGYTAEAEMWIERARKRLRGSGSHQDAFMVECLASAIAAVRGRAATAGTNLQTAIDAVGQPLTVRQRGYATRATLTMLIEQGEFGEAFDDVVAQIDEHGVADVAGMTVAIEYAVARGRLLQAHLSDGDERARRVAQAAAHIRRVARDRRNPRIRAGHLTLRAWTHLLHGRPRAAQRMIHRALRMTDRMDSPLTMFDVLCVHARILMALGRGQDARQRARFALLMAEERGWGYRARWIRDEFAIQDDPSAGSSRGSRRITATNSQDGDSRERRRFEALQQVSATAASVIDPEELIRVALNATMRLLSAERAFLFLVRSESGADRLQPHSGCDAAGNDLTELRDYSSTLVQRVHQNGEALVVTGSEEGAALGSQSAVVHGLRSILVAPLQLKGRQLGVVYLDSRVARGVFTTDDVEMLVAITHQIAASLETTRAARLDAEVQAANHQRRLAETLQASMIDLNATLDPDDVLRRLLNTVVATLPASRGLLLHRRPGQLVLTAQQTPAAGGPPAACDGPAFELTSDPALVRISDASEPVAGDDGATAAALPAPLAHLLGAPRSWLAIPVVLAERHVGTVIVGSDEAGCYTAVEITIAAVLGNQGAAAYERAQLYSRAHEAATIDELTGLATRRHFWELAEQLHASAARHGRPLAAVMLDIDHFKPVNDTYGHAAGDSVLREIAARLRATVRKADIVGRYGGEEFAMLLPESADVTTLAERLRRVVADTAVAIGDQSVSVTISLGITYLRDGDDLDGLLARADTALYRSKREGRDRVTVV